MSSYFSRLSPMERRFAVGVMVVVFLVLNVVFVWPRFGDWGKVKGRLATAQATLQKYQIEVAQTNAYAAQIKNMEEGASVPAEDQAIDFLDMVHNQSAQSEVTLLGSGPRPTTVTNQYFIKQMQSFSVQAREERLLDFLYNLGAGDSAVRVRDLSISPEQPQRQQLKVTVKLEASYQKKPMARPAASASTPAASQPAKPNQR